MIGQERLDFLSLSLERQHKTYIDLALAFKDSAGNLGALAIYKLSIKTSRLNYTEFLEHGGRHIADIRKAYATTSQALLDYISEQDGSVSHRK